MSTIIRDAIVRLKLEQQKAKLEAPDVSAVTRAHDAEKKALAEVAKARREAGAATKEFERATYEVSNSAQRSSRDTERVVTMANYNMVASFREGGEGALRMLRGITLLSSQGSDDLQKLIQKVALAQAAFDIFAGGSKALQMLARMFGGPVAAGVGVATAAITLGATEWNRWKRAAEDAAKAQEELRQAAIKFEQQQKEAWERQQQREGQARRARASGVSLATEFALTPEDRLAGLRNERRALDAEMQEARRDRARRLRGFTANAFGGDADKAFRNLMEFGSSAQLTNAREFEEQRADVARRQLEIDRKIYDINEKSIREAGEAQQQRLAFGLTPAFAPSSGFAGPASSVAVAGAQSGFLEDTKKQLAELLTAQKAANAEMIATFNDAQRKLAELRKELELANPQ